MRFVIINAMRITFFKKFMIKYDVTLFIQAAITCSKSTIETLEQSLKCVQS